MASVNALSREIVFKIVYYGPGLSGKTTTLQHVHDTAKPEHRGKMVSLATPVDRTLYFDFLPIRVPQVRGMGIRLQLFTVPGQVYYNATRKLVLTGADGIVFVSDSQAGRMDANLETLENLQQNLGEHGIRLADFPHVFHHNKRDLPGVLDLDELDRTVNEHGAPSFGTIATSGVGVYEGLEAITRRVLGAFETSLPVGEKTLVPSLAAIEGGLGEALRNADPGATPSPARAIIASLTVPPAASEAVSPLRGDRGAEAPGELAARAALRVDPVAPFTLAALWPEGERATVREAEQALAAGRHARAVELCETLVARALASAAGLLGAAEAPRDAALVPLLLGLSGPRYLAFRALARSARTGGRVEPRAALSALVFAAEARTLRDGLASQATFPSAEPSDRR